MTRRAPTNGEGAPAADEEALPEIVPDTPVPDVPW